MALLSINPLNKIAPSTAIFPNVFEIISKTCSLLGLQRNETWLKRIMRKDNITWNNTALSLGQKDYTMFSQYPHRLLSASSAKQLSLLLWHVTFFYVQIRSIEY